MTRIAGIAALLLWSGCAGLQQPSPGRNPQYQGDVTITPASGRLSAVWHIAFTTDSATQDSARLLLNAGLHVSRLVGEPIKSYTDTMTSTDNRVLTLHYREHQPSGQLVRFAIEYSGAPVFGSDSINNIRSDWIELGLDSFWHPVFASFSRRITGEWRVHLPTTWTGVASGTTSSKGNDISFHNSRPLSDLAFSAAPILRSAANKTASVYFISADTLVTGRLLRTATSCATYLNARFGQQDPLPHAKIVLAPRKGPGYARQNYIMITDAGGMSESALARFLCHEFSHYWSSGANSFGPENWLNEAFAEFVSGRYVRDRFGADAYARILAQWQEASQDTAPVWTPALQRRPGPRVSYRKAPYLLDALARRVGESKMEAILARYMTERISNTPALLSLIGAVAGANHAEWFRQQLMR